MRRRKRTASQRIYARATTLSREPEASSDFNLFPLCDRTTTTTSHLSPLSELCLLAGTAQMTSIPSHTPRPVPRSTSTAHA